MAEQEVATMGRFGQWQEAAGMITTAMAERLQELALQLRRQAADIAAAECRWLVALAEFERDGGWALEGAKSCAAWLVWACGMGPEAARERVRIARALTTLPLVRERFARGELSYSKVRAITRVATAENEALLVTYAQHATAAQLEEVVRGYRRIRETEEDETEGELAHRERRWARWRVDEDGYVHLSARLPADDGMTVVKTLEAVADWLGQQPADTPGSREQPLDPAMGRGDRPVEAKRWETAEPADVRLADALSVLAETTRTHGPAACPGDERYQVVVLVREGVLQGDGAAVDAGDEAPARASGAVGRLAGERLPGPDVPARIVDGPGLDVTSARRIACDASIVALVEDAQGTPLGVGRRGRTVPRRLRRALERRDRGCRFPGCSTRQFVDAHHIWHWSAGGPTELDNLILVCRFHHTLLHEGRFTITQPAPNRFLFHRPDGSVLHPVAPTTGGDADRLAGENLAHGVATTADSLIPDWDGGPQDIDAAIEVLDWVSRGRDDAPLANSAAALQTS
jgi:hypothetical protein